MEAAMRALLGIVSGVIAVGVLLVAASHVASRSRT
jgi:hypothetical protein